MDLGASVRSERQGTIQAATADGYKGSFLLYDGIHKFHTGRGRHVASKTTSIRKKRNTHGKADGFCSGTEKRELKEDSMSKWQ